MATVINENIKDILDKIKNLKIKDVVDLVKAMEEEFGVSAAPVAMAVSAPVAAAVEEEQTEFKVELTSFGDNKINVIKVIRAITNLGLKEAKDLVEALGTIKESVSKDEAASIKKQLEEVGAAVKIS